VTSRPARGDLPELRSGEPGRLTVLQCLRGTAGRSGDRRGLSHQADFRVTLAEVLRLAGRTDESISLLEQALERYEQKGNRVSADATRALLDENAG
jgi:hypothetical protein